MRIPRRWTPHSASLAHGRRIRGTGLRAHHNVIAEYSRGPQTSPKSNAPRVGGSPPLSRCCSLFAVRCSLFAVRVGAPSMGPPRANRKCFLVLAASFHPASQK